MKAMIGISAMADAENVEKSVRSSMSGKGADASDAMRSAMKAMNGWIQYADGAARIGPVPSH
ncbi:MAG: hypothetical protein IKG87_10030 [Clostridia bacterium]|nr:hypothetical protein [Clostridia bacterium]